MNRMMLEPYRQTLFVAGIGLLFLGLVASKALISMGSVVIILSAFMGFRRISFRGSDQAQVFGFGLLLIAPLISGLWSSSIHDWFQVMSNKIMLPALFCAVVTSSKLSQRAFYGLSLFQAVLVVLASLYSVWPLFFQSEGISHSYLQAKTLKVLLSNDHLHFSLYVLITIVWMMFNHSHILSQYGKKVYYLHAAMLIWLIVYLHILGAKTGLILLYGSFLYYWWNTNFFPGRRLTMLIGLGFMVLVGWAAVNWIPTLQNRVYYTLYDFNQYIHGAYIDGLTDGARVLSWKAGMDIANQYPLSGVGFGDLHPVFMAWHQSHSAHLQSYNWLQPSNEWLMYLCGAGIGGALLLTVGLWLIYFYSPYRESQLFQIVFFSQFIMMWYEVNLTNQTGIAIFAFFTGWIHHSGIKRDLNTS